MAKAVKLLVHHIPRYAETSVVAKFSESLVDILQREHVGSTVSANEVKVSCYLEDNRLILSAPVENGESYSCGILARPPFCPIKQLDENHLLNLSPQTRLRGVNVGVSLLYESSDNNILLTQRAEHMRTFPNVWVPPGGHIDPGETFEEAAFREMYEEIGVKPPAGTDQNSSAKLVGLWESVYPPWLNSGLPRRHHVVVYLHVKGKKTSAEVNSLIKLQADEVKCSAWICACLAEKIVSSDLQFSMDEPSGACSSKCCHHSVLNGNCLHGTTITGGHTIQTDSIPFDPMLSIIKDNKNERVSTGTKFALKLWLENFMWK